MAHDARRRAAAFLVRSERSLGRGHHRHPHFQRTRLATQRRRPFPRSQPLVLSLSHSVALGAWRSRGGVACGRRRRASEQNGEGCAPRAARHDRLRAIPPARCRARRARIRRVVRAGSRRARLWRGAFRRAHGPLDVAHHYAQRRGHVRWRALAHRAAAQFGIGSCGRYARRRRSALDDLTTRASSIRRV